ncbi:Lrp/AsnC family transcriptional regulator [Georgenia deserti]|uniref:Lrp/AsnC family transcriptional regulator n=1 Tax=Georgenia deserti TaxID=2093781 RepID=A0ABW4L539_9MICO
MRRARKTTAAPGDPALSLDAIDTQILNMLQLNGRESFREIARAVGVSEGTVRSRVRSLRSSGMVTIAAIANPFKLGYSVMVFCLLKTEVGSQQAVIDAMAPWDEITYISSCTGRADLYVQMVCRDHEHLWEILNERVPAVTGIRSVETFHEIKMHKVSYVYPDHVDSPDAGPLANQAVRSAATSPVDDDARDDIGSTSDSTT